MIPIGLILLAIGIGLLIAQVMAVKTTQRLRSTQRSTVADLQKLVGGVAGEMGSGSYRQAVAVAGRIAADQPLTAPMSDKACVYFRAWVVRRYEEEEVRTDAEGNRRRVTETGSDTVSDQSERRDFTIDDGSGQLLIMVQDARLDDTTETVDRFEPGEESGATLRIGSFSLTLPGAGGARRTIGYEYHEHILPVGQQVTVTGEVSDQGGQLALRNSKDTPLVVSMRSYEEQLAGAEKKARFRRIAGIACAAVGVVVLVIGLIQG